MVASAAMAEREFSTARRRRLESEGETGYGESYPMPDCTAVERAIKAYGRAPVEHRAELRRAIIRRRAELGCHVDLPDSWHVREL